jgi:hypothetical protein
MKRNAPSPIVTTPSTINGEDGQEHKKQKLMNETVSGEPKNELTREQKRKEKKASKVVAKIEVSILARKIQQETNAQRRVRRIHRNSSILRLNCRRGEIQSV